MVFALVTAVVAGLFVHSLVLDLRDPELGLLHWQAGMGTQAVAIDQPKAVVARQAIGYYAKGVGLVVVERPVVLAALEAAEV